jgi:hypothetical protein
LAGNAIRLNGVFFLSLNWCSAFAGSAVSIGRERHSPEWRFFSFAELVFGVPGISSFNWPGTPFA